MIAVSIAVFGACAKPTALALRDTENRPFKATCNEGECALEGSSPATPSASKPEGATASYVLHHASRLYAVCDVWAQGSRSFTISPIDCRPLACENDTQCPVAKGLSRGACTNGLCIEPTGALSSEDAGLLCLVGAGAPSGSSKQVERYSLGSNCGSPCMVPTVCRQP